MLPHGGIARGAGIGVGATATTRRTHNLLICPRSPAAYRYLLAPKRFAGSPRPATVPTHSLSHRDRDPVALACPGSAKGA
jgi:hypothetical protein